jgi:heterodisulfide reductase subunit C
MNIKNYKIERLNYCINCEYDCESVCPVYKITNNESLTPKNKAIKALNSIKHWDFSDNADLYACINCNNCKNYCPHKNDVSEVLSYAKEKIISTDNAKDEILKFEENFYEKLDLIEIIELENMVKLKNLPDFLAFYNLGFRDETITELKILFRKIEHNTVIVEDISFIYLLKKLNNSLKDIKIPHLMCDFNKKTDHTTTLIAGLDISSPYLHTLFLDHFREL